jgi:hypothetical protein
LMIFQQRRLSMGARVSDTGFGYWGSVCCIIFYSPFDVWKESRTILEKVK